MNPLPLLIDHREMRSGILDVLQTYSDLFTIKTCVLDAGDYILDDKIIIERKTLIDFICSIKDGRIFRQAYKRVDTKKAYVVVLEGDKASVKNSKISREVVQGTIAHLSVFLGASILRSNGVEETAKIICYLANQLMKAPKIIAKKPILKNNHLKLKKNQKDVLTMVQNIPGIGYKKALALLNKFGTIKKLSNAQVKRLMKVQGIGKKRAEDIYSFFNYKF